MTRDKAVKMLQATRLMLMDGANQPISDLYYALDMAIEALNEADTPQTEQMKTADYCDICKQDMCEFCIADASNPYCVPSHYEIKQTERNDDE